MDGKRLFKLRAAAIPTLIAIIALLETQKFSSSFRFFTLVTSFLLLADIASFSRVKLRDVCLVLASVVFGLIVVEGAAIVAEPKISTHVSDSLYGPKPVVGWGPSHAGRYHEERIDSSTGRAIYSVAYTIDEDLLRQTHSATSGLPIVFFGDSLTFGSGLNDPDTLPQQFADLLDQKIRVLNFAFSGYGPSQFLRILQDDSLASVIGPKQRFFVFLTAAWQAERTACKSDWTRLAPRFVLERDQPVLKGTCRDGQWPWLRDGLQPFASYRLLVEPLILKPDDDDVELYIRTLLAAVRIAEERYGTRTIVPYVRSSGYLQTTKFTDESVMERLREGGAIVIDASLQQEEKAGAVLNIPGDGHPTRLANDLRARMLKDYVERNMDGTLLSGLK
jgi:hypothetical protein